MTVLTIKLRTKAPRAAAVVSGRSIAAMGAKILIDEDNENVDCHSLTLDQYLVQRQILKTRPG